MDQLPVLLDAEKLFDGMFATDASEIIGRWRVWAFIKIAGIDVANEIEGAKEALKEYANLQKLRFLAWDWPQTSRRQAGFGIGFANDLFG